MKYLLCLLVVILCLGAATLPSGPNRYTVTAGQFRLHGQNANEDAPTFLRLDTTTGAGSLLVAIYDGTNLSYFWIPIGEGITPPRRTPAE